MVYNNLMVAFNESNLVPCNPSRTRPRVQGPIFATNRRTFQQEPSLKRSSSQPQGLLGDSPTSHKRLHRADHSNQQYSILALTDSSGAVVERVAYQAYGQPMFTNAARTNLSSSAKAIQYSYTGREWDSSLDLHQFRARWMSGVSGRFCGRDSIGYYGSESLFAGAFLVRDKDPLGLWRVVGIHVMPPPDNSRRPIWMRDPGDGVGAPCVYTLPPLNGIGPRISIAIPCPEVRIDDPGGPEYTRGMKDFYELYETIKNACNSDQCCGPCTKAVCVSESARLVAEVMLVWQENYNHRQGEPDEQVAGNWCYEWATMFRDAVRNLNLKCSSVAMGRAYVEEDYNRGLDSMRCDYWLNIKMGNGGGPNILDPNRAQCQYWIDDGFTPGKRTSNPGKPAPTWKGEYWPTNEEDVEAGVDIPTKKSGRNPWKWPNW